VSLKEKILRIFDKIFPSKIICGFCGKELFKDGDIRVCDECLSKLKPIEKPCIKCGVEVKDLSSVCDVCKTKKFTFKRAVACFNFDEITKPIIHKLKYDGGQYLAEILAKFMAKVVLENEFDFDAILYVPMHNKRKIERGYNQSKLLAIEIGKILNKSVLENTLVKTKHTKNQADLSFKLRAENLKNSFEVVDKNVVKNKRILLVDDVFTTGSTVEEISKTLKQAGVKEVNVITFCHTLFDNKNITAK